MIPERNQKYNFNNQRQNKKYNYDTYVQLQYEINDDDDDETNRVNESVLILAELVHMPHYSRK